MGLLGLMGLMGFVGAKVQLFWEKRRKERLKGVKGEIMGS
jgi:hypothetical protein